MPKVHALAHPRADHLGMTGSARGAIDSILENLVPEDVLDSGTDWNRRCVLADTIMQANAGDEFSIGLLKARPHLALFDELTKKWVEQVDSGPRSPGISAQRDRIIRTRPPER
jgi:hypothetical protein